MRFSDKNPAESNDLSRAFVGEPTNACLGPLAGARGVRLVSLDEVDSTNDEAKRLFNDGERGPLWIVAARQSRGRGRLGRQWISERGNLHASLVLAGVAPMPTAPQLGFVAGVAAIEALRDLTGAGARLALKWPNDLLLDGAKLGGVLLEGVVAQTEFAAIVGIGVNCAFAPDGLPYKARALDALGAGAPKATDVFARLSDAFATVLDDWSRDGFARLRDRWLSYAAGVGEPIRVALAREMIEGRFETIDEAGRLIVAVGDGRRVVEAGDVFFARAGATGLEHAGTHP